MSFYGIGDGSSFFNSFFGTSSSGNSANGISLSEWSMIKGGTYKRLLNSYYSENKNGAVTSIGKRLGIDKEAAKEFSAAGNDADSLAKAADKVTGLVKDMSEKYSDAGDAEKGRFMNELYDAASKYVEAYNSTVKSVSEVDNTSMLRNELSITTSTAANKKMLSKLGITIGSENKLAIDKDKFMKSDMADIKTMFMGRNSYMSRVQTNASMIRNTAAAATATASRAYTYTKSGTYSGFDTGMLSSYTGKM